jgi:hypothetical protein
MSTRIFCINCSQANLNEFFTSREQAQAHIDENLLPKLITTAKATYGTGHFHRMFPTFAGYWNYNQPRFRIDEVDLFETAAELRT